MPPIFEQSKFLSPLPLAILMFLVNHSYGLVLAQSDLETAVADQPIFTNRPPRARLFVGKPSQQHHHHHHYQQSVHRQMPSSSASPPSPTVLAQMMRANPLLATLNMFSNNDGSNQNDDAILGTTPTMLAMAKASGTMPTANPSASVLPNLIAKFPTRNMTAQQQQMDNFDMLYQIFNATMFDLAEPQEEQSQESPFLLQFATRAEERRRAEASKSRSSVDSHRSEFKFYHRSNQLELGEATDQHGSAQKQKEEALIGFDQMLDEEHNSTMPFEVTDALTNALSPNGTAAKNGTMPTTTTTAQTGANNHVGTGNEEEEEEEQQQQLTALQTQEQFPLDELRQRLKYPWERQRGEYGTGTGTTTMESATTTTMATYAVVASTPLVMAPLSILAPSTSAPLLPSVMPGASFYVDQHVSRGSFGRDGADSTPNLVYDPNVLQSRYGFSGLLLPEAEADDVHSVRGQRWPPTTTRQRGPYASHWSIRPAAAAAPARSAVLPSAAAAVFIIPPSPQLSVARAVPLSQVPRTEMAPSPRGTTNWPPTTGAAGATAAGHKKLGFWPQLTSSTNNDSANCDGHTEQQKQQMPMPLATTAGQTVPNGDEKLVPFNGNHLQWMPARIAAKGVPTSSANRRTTAADDDDEDNLDIGTRRWPCLADPVDLVLADSPPAVGQPIAACFRRMRQCVLRRAPPPLQRRVGLSRVECIQFCVGLGQCSSLTYAHPSSTCELFHARNGTGTAQLVHHREFDYFESKLGHGTALRDCWDDFLPHDGPPDEDEDDDDVGPKSAATTVKQLLVDSGDEFGGGQQRDTLYYSSRTTVPYPSSSSPTISTTSATTTTTVTTAASSKAPPAAPREACASADRDIVVFKSKGYRLATPGGGGTGGAELAAANSRRQTVGEPPPVPAKAVLTQHSSETECSFSCLVNMANGATPFECLAATFDSALALCSLHGIGSSADGSIHLVPDPTFSHYEKGCILTEIVELCRGYPIIRFPQKTLLGFAIGTRRAASLLDCLELCLAHNNFNHNRNQHSRRSAPSSSSSSTVTETAAPTVAANRCRSVVFFYEESAITAVVGDGSDAGDTGGASDGQNCVLNSESGDSAPQFFVDETEALVDYASFDDCYQLGGDTGANGDRDDEPTAATGGEKRAASGTEVGSSDAGRVASDRLEATVTLDRKKVLPKLHKLRPLPEQQQNGVELDLKNTGLKWRRRLSGQKIVPDPKALGQSAPIGIDGIIGSMAQLTTSAAKHQREEGNNGPQLVAELSAAYSIQEKEERAGRSKATAGSRRTVPKTIGGEGRHRQQKQTMRVEGQTKMGQRHRRLLRWRRSNTRRRPK